MSVNYRRITIRLSPEIGCEILARCGNEYTPSIGREILRKGILAQDFPPSPDIPSTTNGASLEFDIMLDVGLDKMMILKTKEYNDRNPGEKATKTGLYRRLFLLGMLERFPIED